MSRSRTPLMDLAPLMKASGLDVATTSSSARGGTHRIPAGQTYLAELVGVNIRSVVRWLAHGIPLGSAEDVCFALGMHPVDVWGDAWLFAAGCPLAKVACAAPSPPLEEAEAP